MAQDFQSRDDTSDVDRIGEDLDEMLADDGGGEDGPRGRRLDADTILDSIVPSTIDWRETVGRHPLASVACVGIVGYLVGRTKGAAIMSGITTGLSAAMMRQLADVFEGDFFDF